MADDGVQPYNLFTLTDLIGKKATDKRTTVVLTVETPLRVVVWGVISGVIFVIFALVLGFATPIRQWAILVPLLGVPAVVAFTNMRGRRGLQLTHLERTFDALSSRPARKMILHLDRLYDPMQVSTATVAPASVDVEEIEGWPRRDSSVPLWDEDVEDSFVESSERRLSMRSARAAAEERTYMMAGLMEAQRVIEREQFAVRADDRAAESQRRAVEGLQRGEDSAEEVAA